VTTANVVFLVVLVLALGFFAYSAQRLYAFMTRVGKPEDRSNDPGRRFWNLLTVGLAQTKILRDPVAGLSHALVFWGFCVITLGTAEMLVQGVWGGFAFARFLPAALYAPFALSQELFALLVFAAVAYLIYRRLVIKPRRLQGDGVETREAVIILSVIAVLMFTLLLTNGMEARLDAGAPANRGRLVGGLLGRLFAGVPEGAAHAARDASWWTHALLVLGFLNYLPFSKHLHVLVSLPNTYLSNTEGPGQKGVMRYMDLEDESAEQFGVSDVEHLTWKNLLDGYACTQCGRCTAACPANITGKLLSPRKIVVNVRQRTMEKAPLVAGDFDELARPRLDGGEGADGMAARGVAPGSAPSTRSSATRCSTTTSPRRSSGRARAAARACTSAR
jgi:ferredoxin/nitrate reductase gamma subunit